MHSMVWPGFQSETGVIFLNQAIDTFLDIQRWQIKHIQTSIKQADATKFIGHEEIKRRATSWRHRS